VGYIETSDYGITTIETKLYCGSVWLRARNS